MMMLGVPTTSTALDEFCQQCPEKNQEIPQIIDTTQFPVSRSPPPPPPPLPIICRRMPHDHQANHTTLATCTTPRGGRGGVSTNQDDNRQTTRTSSSTVPTPELELVNKCTGSALLKRFEVYGCPFIDVEASHRNACQDFRSWRLLANTVFASASITLTWLHVGSGLQV